MAEIINVFQIIVAVVIVQCYPLLQYGCRCRVMMRMMMGLIPHSD